MMPMRDINSELLAQVIEAVHQAQMEECYALSIPRLSEAIAIIYQESMDAGVLISAAGISKRLRQV